MFGAEAAGELLDGRPRQAKPSLGISRDPVGTDVGERLRTVRLWWIAMLGAEEFGDLVCLTHTALNPKCGPARIVKVLHRSIYRRAVVDLAAGVIGRLGSDSQQKECLTIQVVADYHWPYPLLRRRREKVYPREELPIHRSWQFTTGDPQSSAFSIGFFHLYRTIQQEGWPLDANQRANLTKLGLAVRSGQLLLRFADGPQSTATSLDNPTFQDYPQFGWQGG